MKTFEEMLNKKTTSNMYKTVTLKIDGDSVMANIISRDEFIRTFNELETLMCSDDKKYWVLYEEHAPETLAYIEIFWCIPTHEIDFIWNEEDGWHIASGVGVTKGRVTLDEEEDECEFELVLLEDVHEEELILFDEFAERFKHYLLFDKRADENTFKLWKALTQDIASAQTVDIMTDNKVCLVTWLRSNWGAFFECILDESFKYMNVTELVLESWNEFCN